MKNTYFSLDATLKQLLRRLQEYAQMSLPSEYEYLRLAADPPVPLFPEEGLSWLGTFCAVCTVEDDVPFFEMGVQEVDGVCRVRIRCLDPKAATWVRDMIRWLAPGRASRFVQPLPDLPAPPSSTATPTPASGSVPVPTPASLPVPGPEARVAPRAPRRPADLRRWKAAWRKIKPLVAEGRSNEYIEGWLLKHDDDIQPSKESIIRIIAAGEAGLLD